MTLRCIQIAERKRTFRTVFTYSSFQKTSHTLLSALKFCDAVAQVCAELQLLLFCFPGTYVSLRLAGRAMSAT